MRFTTGLVRTPRTSPWVMDASCSASATRVHCLLVVVVSSCGLQTNPTPTLTSLSPSTATREGPAFTLTVSGSNFVSGSAVQWNGSARPTTFVSSTQLAAQIATTDIVVAESYSVNVVSPSPGGGASAPLAFNVPCVLAAQGPAATQTRARLGAYYFDGWSGPLTNFHFQGLPTGPYAVREPLSGWRDNNECAVEQQLAWATSFGIKFFVFDWYYNASSVDPGEDLNGAFEIARLLPDHHGMQYALLYVNSAPFIAGPADWTSTINQWIGYFQDPDYLRIDGQPALFVIDMYQMRQTFGSSPATAAALDQLRAAARTKGLPGVFVVGGFGVGSGTAGENGSFPNLSVARSDGYDAVTLYGYPFAPPPIDGMLPFSALADAGVWIWSQAALKSPVPFISVAMDGWDPRPWDERESSTNDLVWYSRTPQDVSTFVGDAITFAESNPRLRPEPPPVAPLVLVEAWNELGEGSFVTPTYGDGQTYGDALTAMLTVPPTRTRSVLTLAETGASAFNRVASGTLTDSAGSANAGVSITLVATPVDGPGSYSQYDLSGEAPAAAITAVVGFRVNLEGGGPGLSDFSLYQVSYIQDADGVERVSNGSFSLGSQAWGLGGQAQLVASDRGTGQMVAVETTVDQLAELTSAPFAVTAGGIFHGFFAARVAPSSTGSGYFMLIFQDGTGEFLREEIPLKAGTVPLGSATTDGTGSYALAIGSLGDAGVVLEATYAGDAQHWPGYARVGP
jgi:hypothetical protein